MHMPRRLRSVFILAILFSIVFILFDSDSYKETLLSILGTADYVRKRFQFEQGEPRTVFNSIQENVTLVTAYFSLGSFQKGFGKHFHEHTYTTWATTFEYLVNPLVVYTDSDKFVKFMSELRKDLPRKTKIVKIERNELWSFQIIDKIQKIFNLPGYPKHHPNTVVPAYSSAQHSKYAVVAHAIKHKYFKNEFYAWIDIGYFRDSVNDKHYFQLFAPSSLERKKLAINQIWKHNSKLLPSSIFRGNHVWVGGGMFIGTPELLLNFEKLYMRAVNFYLDKQVINSDQQVLYSLFSEEGRKTLKPNIELQLYVPHQFSGDPWFYLGYHCRVDLPIWICPSRYQECPLQKTTTTVFKPTVPTTLSIKSSSPFYRTTTLQFKSSTSFLRTTTLQFKSNTPFHRTTTLKFKSSTPFHRTTTVTNKQAQTTIKTNLTKISTIQTKGYQSTTHKI